jgi:hypothetical protein
MMGSRAEVRGRGLRKVALASVAAVFLLAGQAQASAIACFTPADAKAAQFRRMQQEFTVAALSCGRLQSQRDYLTDHYNQFITKFATVLRDNARVLLAHFSNHGGADGFDSWMTKLANAAATDVATDPTYCTHLWVDLDTVLTVDPSRVTDFAAAIRPADELTPVCAARRPTTTASSSQNLKD